VGDRVRDKRLGRGLSQERLGEDADLHRTYIGRLERGEVNPTLANLVRVAAALGVDTGELVEGLSLDPSIDLGMDDA
jgi:transcriptional regulator with XRE-family HTH domain